MTNIALVKIKVLQEAIMTIGVARGAEGAVAPQGHK